VHHCTTPAYDRVGIAGLEPPLAPALPPLGAGALRIPQHYLSGKYQIHNFKMTEYTLASMAEPETLRLLLQKTLDRNDGLVKMNHEATLAIPTILAAVWGVIVGFARDSNSIVYFAVITIGILLLWRYFAHYIDDDVASNYSRIMQIENELDIQDCSIYSGLIRKISKNDEFLTKAKKLPIDEKIKLVDQLQREKRLGYRGHDKWDNVAFVLIFLFSVVSISTIFQSISKITHIFHPNSLVVLTVFIKIAFLGFTLFIGFLLTIIIVLIFQKIALIQKDPGCDELEKIYQSVSKKKMD
jgi:hypothetical protein